MAESKNENANRSRWRFLVDASESRAGREYGIYYDSKGMAAHIEAFDRGGRKIDIEPGEVIFAIDHERYLDVKNNRVETTVYQVEIGEGGLIDQVGTSGADYDVRTISEGGEPPRYGVEYNLAPYSRFEMEVEGFSPNFPGSYKHDVTGLAGPEAVVSDTDGQFERLRGNFVANLPFPPFHPGTGASVAKANIDDSRPPYGLSGLSDAFNFSAPPPPEDPKISDATLEAAIKKLCTDMTEKARNGDYGTVIAREDDMDKIIRVMCSTIEPNPCLVADSGAGKTSVVKGLAQRIVRGDVPPALRGRRLLSVNLMATLGTAGAMFRGQVEKDIRNIFEGLAERGFWFKGQKVSLFMDEVHAQLKIGGSTNAGDMIKEAIQAPGASVIAATDKWEKVEDDPAIAGRFQKILLSKYSRDQLLDIAENGAREICEKQRVKIRPTRDELALALDITDRHDPDKAQPKKILKSIDLAAAAMHVRGGEKIEQEDWITSFSDMFSVPREEVGQTDVERARKVEEQLPQRVLNQPGVMEIVKVIKRKAAGLGDPNRPPIFLLLGVTGAGKTETAKALADLECNGNMIKINMGEYMERHSVSRLIGTSPGYVGFGEEGVLTGPVKRNPYSVVLMDESEKAHPDVWNTVLLSVGDDGLMKDGRGRSVDFRHTIILLTSNVGAREVSGMLEKGTTRKLGFGARDEDVAKVAEGKFDQALKDYFPPEIINRLDGVILYRPLPEPAIRTVVERQVGIVGKRLAANGARGVKLEVSGDVMDTIAHEAYDPSLNARPAIRAVAKRIETPLADWLLAPATDDVKGPTNRDELIRFARENDGARLVIDALDEGFKPRIEKLPIAPVRSIVIANTNDNTGRGGGAGDGRRAALAAPKI